MNHKILKKIFIIILILLFLLAFSSSYSALNINNLAIVVAMGIDVADNNNLKLTFQFTNTSSISETGSSEKSPSIIYTVEASSISSGINLINSHIGKELSLSHCKLIAFSEELASKGISKEIYTLVNDTQVRPSTNIIITKCTAKYYLESSKPLFESLLTKYYEVFSDSSKYTGFSSSITIGEFFNKMLCTSCQPSAILGGVEDGSQKTPTSNINSENIISNSSPVSGDSKAENIGLAVFKDDVLVGELNSIETLCSLIIGNKVSGFLVSVPNPSKSNSYLDIYITPLNETKFKVDIINGTPYISVKCRFTGRIYSMEENSKYLDDKLLKEISDSCNSYIKSVMTDYLYKTSKYLKSDINSFGKAAQSKFLTTKDFNNYNWNEKYKDSFFDVEIDSSIRSSFLITES